MDNLNNEYIENTELESFAIGEVVRLSKQLEAIFKYELNAEGRGLHEYIDFMKKTFADNNINVKRLRKIATIRNNTVHNPDANPNISEYSSMVESAILELRQFIYKSEDSKDRKYSNFSTTRINIKSKIDEKYNFNRHNKYNLNKDNKRDEKIEKYIKYLAVFILILLIYFIYKIFFYVDYKALEKRQDFLKNEISLIEKRVEDLKNSVEKESKENHNAITKHIWKNENLKKLKVELSNEEKTLKEYLKEKEEIEKHLSNKQKG